MVSFFSSFQNGRDGGGLLFEVVVEIVWVFGTRGLELGLEQLIFTIYLFMELALRFAYCKTH